MYQQITLPNGARLLTEEVPGARSAALGFFVGVGSRHERQRENGAAHFIEHMLFKGTQRRSTAQLARDMDAIGGQVNAYTTKEHTCFYARSLDKHLDISLDILSDMLFHSRFDQGDVETERGVVLEEIGMYEDSPEDLVSERLAAAVYKGSPLARPILGTQATLTPMTGEWLAQWQREHYRPGALVAALAVTTIQLFHGRSIVKSVVPSAVTRLDMKIGSIVDQKQSLLPVGIRPQYLHFRHGRSQFLYRFLYQRIITVIVDCLNGVQVNGLSSQNRKRSFIVASIFQLKPNPFDPVHSLCRNFLIDADRLLQRQVIVIFSKV